jgi:hypothetical protein
MCKRSDLILELRVRLCLQLHQLQQLQLHQLQQPRHHNTTDTSLTMAKPLINLPFPQELKDEIYSYLLTPDAAIELPTKGDKWRRRYRHFETAILCVNKSIGDDAARYFYSQNSFVRISHKACDDSGMASNFFGLLTSLGARLYDVRTDNHISNLAYTINVFSPPEEYFFSWDHLSGPNEALMLEQDIKKLWTVLRMASPYRPPDCVTIRSARGEKLKLSGASLSGSAELDRIKSRASPIYWEDRERILNQEPPSVEIYAESSKYVELSAARKITFCHSACNAVGNFFRVTFRGFSNGILEYPRRTTATTIVWPQAFAWSRLDLIFALKTEADDLVLAAKPLAALQVYRYAEQFGEDWIRATDGEEEAQAVLEDAEHLQFDVTFSIALLHFHLDGQPLSDCYGRHYDGWIKRPHASASRLEHYIAIYDISWGYVGEVSRSAELLEALVLLRALPQNPMIAHDINFIEHILSTEIVSSNKCSTCTTYGVFTDESRSSPEISRRRSRESSASRSFRSRSSTRCQLRAAITTVEKDLLDGWTPSILQNSPKRTRKPSMCSRRSAGFASPTGTARRPVDEYSISSHDHADMNAHKWDRGGIRNRLCYQNHICV